MKNIYRKTIKRIIKSNRIINTYNPFNNKTVSDGFFAELSYNASKGWIFSNIHNVNSSNTSNGSIIIVVLESPHIDEFDPKKGNCLCPLYKSKRFEQFFVKLYNGSTVLSSLNTSVTYYIYFMNAIEYQCSLGMPTEYYRDFVFTYYWERKNNDFITKVQTFIQTYNNVEAIINCCSIGSHKNHPLLFINGTYKKCYKTPGPLFFKLLGCSFSAKNLQDAVENSIVSALASSTIPHVKGSHPSMWNNKTKSFK